MAASPLVNAARGFRHGTFDGDDRHEHVAVGRNRDRDRHGRRTRRLHRAGQEHDVVGPSVGAVGDREGIVLCLESGKAVLPPSRDPVTVGQSPVRRLRWQWPGLRGLAAIGSAALGGALGKQRRGRRGREQAGDDGNGENASTDATHGNPPGDDWSCSTPVGGNHARERTSVRR